MKLMSLPFKMSLLTNNTTGGLRILFICPYIPSLIRVRPYNFIKFLALQGHNITLLALIPPGEQTNSLKELQQWCIRVETVSLPRWRTLWNGVSVLPDNSTSDGDSSIPALFLSRSYQA